jgi:ankyrin repeat protein
MLDVLKEFAKTDRSQLFKADQNGWRPLHEAARGGRHEVIEYLLAEGTYSTSTEAIVSTVGQETAHEDLARATKSISDNHTFSFNFSPLLF